MTTAEIKSLMDVNEDFFFGFRSVDNDEYNVDDVIFEPSKNWRDVPTDDDLEAAGTTREAFEAKYGDHIDGYSFWDEELDGVCATNIRDFPNVAAALEFNRRRYGGQVVYLLVSNDVQYGEDEHEIIMTNPKVLAKL